VTRATQPAPLPKFVMIIGAIMAIASFAYVYKSCAELPAQPISIYAYKQNIPEFQTMLPQWSKLIQAESQRPFLKDPEGYLEGYVKGKIIILSLSDDNSCTLADQNVNWRLHESHLIASSPEEVGTVVFIHSFRDRSALYQTKPGYAEEGQAIYTLMYYKVYIADTTSGEIVGRAELHSTWVPPPTIQGSETEEPVAELADYVIHLTKHKTDREMIDFFQAHKTDFAELLQMFRSDKGLLYLSAYRTSPENPQSVGITADRLKEYQAVFSRIGIDGIGDLSQSGSRDEVWFFTSIEGPWFPAFEGHEVSFKGYAFIAQPTRTIVQDLDYGPSNSAPYDLIKAAPYRLIGEHWYLTLDIGGKRQALSGKGRP